MARITFPETFLKQSELFKTVKAKHEADGPASPLIAFLLEQEIVLADDELARLAAASFEDDRLKQKKQSEDLRQKRDLLFAPVMRHLRGYFQFLKRFYNGRPQEVGAWGASVLANGRIVYPAHFLKRKKMFKVFTEKYNSYPAGTSPLDAYLVQNELSIADDTTALDQASDLHDQFQSLSRLAEKSTAQRNFIWNPVLEHLHNIGGFLMALFFNNPKQLGYWGYQVDEAKKAHKVVVSKVKLMSQKIANTVIIGGTFTNLGRVPLTIHKGRKVTTAGIIVPPGGRITITRGFSTLTVVNPSPLETGIFSTLKSQ